LVPAARIAATAPAWQASDGVASSEQPLVDLVLAHWRRRARAEPALAAPLLAAEFSEAEFAAALALLRAEAVEPWEALDVFDRLLAEGLLRCCGGPGERRYHLAGGGPG